MSTDQLRRGATVDQFTQFAQAESSDGGCGMWLLTALMICVRPMMPQWECVYDSG